MIHFAYKVATTESQR